MAFVGTDSAGMQDIRGINVDKTLSGFALQEYIFKQICAIQSSSKWEERYFQESSADLTGGTGSAVEGVPRLANFPHMETAWTRAESFHKKHGGETRISHEDIISNDVPTIARSLLRLARAITKSVDLDIWETISESTSGSYPRTSATNTNVVTITAGHEWDSATIALQNPIQDILNAKKEIAVDNYNPDREGYLLLSPKDYANLLGNANIRNAGQFYTDDVTRNGKVGFLLGLKVLVSNNVYTDYAMVCVGKECANWKSLQALTVVQIEDAGIGTTIRAWEIGVCQLVNPEAVCIIANTQA